LFARAIVKFSSISPNIIINATSAAALYSPINSAPIIATLTITPAVRSRFKMPRAASTKIGEPLTSVAVMNKISASKAALKIQLASAPPRSNMPFPMVARVFVESKKVRYRTKNDNLTSRVRHVVQPTVEGS
jgi:hypothetical protein